LCPTVPNTKVLEWNGAAPPEPYPAEAQGDGYDSKADEFEEDVDVHVIRV